MERDKFWESSVPKELPYTIAALPFRRETDPFSLSKSSRDIDIAVYMFNRNTMPRSTPLPGLIRHPSDFSLTPSRQTSMSNSIISSIRGAMMGRKTSESYSEWSHEAGMYIIHGVMEEKLFFKVTLGFTSITS